MPVINSIAANHDEMTAWRRDLHAHPEIGFEEVRTAGIVAEKLQSWGIEVHTGIAKTGVVGVLKGRGQTGRAIGLRADMDALPMTEETGLPYQSQNPGAFHGCGHDGHTTMLLGAARYLSETRNFDGTVVFLFQPAEEGAGGGRVMVEEGVFDRFPCDEVYALHNWPMLPVGELGIVAGPAMAATDTFSVTVSGVGGHAAMPQRTVDPIVIASQIVTAWQSLVSRTTDPIKSAVLSVTQFHAGSAFNVIPADVTLSGTVRTFDRDVRDGIRDGMTRLAEGIAAGFGGSAQVAYVEGYPATVNPPDYADQTTRIAEGVVGTGNVRRDLDPVMGGEDFSYMLNERPGTYVLVGQDGGPTACSVHNPKYDFNDAILPIGASLLATLAEQRLR